MESKHASAIATALGASAEPSADVRERVTFYKALASEEEVAMFQFLVNIGVVFSKRQVDLRTRVVTESVLEDLQKLDSSLDSSPFLSGESAGTADAYTLCAVLPIVNTVLDPKDRVAYGNIGRWIDECLKLDAFNGTLHPNHLHRANESRIGRQIDLRADPKIVRTSANETKAINKDFKAKKSQRKLEKEKKAEVNPAKATTLSFSLGDAVARDIEKSVKIANVLERLDKLSIAHRVVEHEAAADMASLMTALKDQPGTKCKNLFLKAKKPRNSEDSKVWLVSVPNETTVDLKFLQKKLGYPSAGILRFGDGKTLESALHCVQGDVSPFSLLNDSAVTVNVVLDANMVSDPKQELWFHPLTNEASCCISAEGLLKYIAASGRAAHLVDFANLDAPMEMSNVGLPDSMSEAAAPAVDAQPLEKLPPAESQARLWAKLSEIGVAAPHKEDPDKVDPSAARPVGHHTHNLFLKDKKSKQRYLVSMSQEVHCNLKEVAKLVGAKELRMCSDRVDCLGSEQGCITLLSLYNNVEGNVIPVVIGDLMDAPDKVIRVCAGCENPLDHTQHNVVDITIAQLQTLLSSNPKLPPIMKVDM